MNKWRKEEGINGGIDRLINEWMKLLNRQVGDWTSKV